ncbi:MAG TPA: hypothetical protein VMU17_06185, partial [Elusimicrobiota bacterium]|nr:hypothetical protein [Elusimicrobiota bacterium]
MPFLTLRSKIMLLLAGLASAGLVGLSLRSPSSPKQNPFQSKFSVPAVTGAPLPLLGPGPKDPPIFEDGYRVISFAILGSFNYRAKRDTFRPRRLPLPG